MINIGTVQIVNVQSLFLFKSYNIYHLIYETPQPDGISLSTVTNESLSLLLAAKSIPSLNSPLNIAGFKFVITITVFPTKSSHS